MPDIVDLAISGKFNTLVAAVKAAGLVDTLKGPGPFTVFAPTDEAFAKLPPGTVDGLLKDIPQVEEHPPLPCRSWKGNGRGCRKIENRQDRPRGEVRFEVNKGHLQKNVMVNNANIIKTDIVATTACVMR